MKLTPLILFLITLTVLVIAMLLGNSFLLKEGFEKKKKEKEGFVSFQNALQENSNAYIPQYSKNTSKTVLSLYDNLYFDTVNGNLIEVDSLPCGNVRGNVTCNDVTGSTINNIYISTRDGYKTVKYTTLKNVDGSVKPQDVPEADVKQVTPINNEFSYITNSVNTDKYEVFYIGWGSETYFHVMDITDLAVPKNLYSYALNDTLGLVGKSNFLNSNSSIPTNTAGSNSDVNNGKTYTDLKYDADSTIYQLTKYVKYDFKRGNLILSDSALNNITIYNRGNKGVSGSLDKSSKLQKLDTFNAWVVPTPNSEMVLVMANGLKTIVSIISLVGKKYTISHCARFTETGIATEEITSTCKTPKIEHATYPSVVGKTSNVCGDELSCKWYWYFKTLGGDNTKDNFTDDYMLKTQIVPPVCPTCPTCPTCPSGNTLCTNCGGQGGSGTLCSSGNSVIKDSSGNVKLNDTSKQLTQNTGSNAADVLRATGSDAANLLRATGSGTANLLRDTGSGTANLLRDTGSGAAGFVKDVGSGAAGFVKDVGSGILSLGRQNQGQNQNQAQNQNPATSGYYNSYNGPAQSQTQGQTQLQQQGQTQGQGQGQQGQTQEQGVVQPTAYRKSSSNVDNYSYYGALESKGGNYMPVTADFSSFRK